MTSIKMCDKATRVWCCRIGLVFSISAVLLSMMFQIWSYYFSLVQEMDTLSSSEPRLGALLSICDGKIDRQWNMDCSVGESQYNCSSPVSGSVYVDSTCSLNNIEKFERILLPLSECCRLMLWILPW